MPADGVVTVGTQVNVAPLKTGMAEAQAAVKQASDNMAAAQAAFGKAAEAGNAQAIAALKSYEAELASASAALAAFTGAEERETAALRTSISARTAASAELRVLEGNFMGSTRAAGAFLSTLPGIGAAMQVAFPVFGVVALVEILGRGVMALAEWTKGLDQLSSKEKEVHDQLIKNAEDELRHSTILVKANYDLAIAKAGTPIEKDQLRVQMEAALVGLGEKRLQQLEAAKKSLEDYATQQKAIATAMAQETQSLAGGGLSGTSGAGTIGTTIMGSIANKQADSISAKGPNGEASPLEQNKALIEEANAAVKEAQADQLNAQAALARGYEKVGEAGKKAFGDIAMELVRSDQLAVESGKRVNEALTASFDKMYDEDMQAAKLQDEQRKAATREYLEGEKQVLKMAEQNIDAAHEVAKARLEAQQVSITAVRAAGLSSPEAELDQMKALHKAELKEEQDYLTAKIELMKKDPNADPTQLNQLQAKLTVSQQGTAPLINAKDNLAQMKLVSDTFKNSVNQMNQEFNSAIDGWLRGTERFSQAFTRMADNMAITFVNNLLKMGEQWVQHEVMKLAIHTATNEGIMTQDQAAAALSQATSAKSVLEQITHYAALAAAKAYSALADIPVVGPALGAVAAGATFVAVEALAAFDKGTSLIPRDGIAMLHKGEAVLPPPQTDALMDALGAGSRGSKPGSSFRDFNLTYHGGQSSGPEDMFSMARKHSRLMNWSQ